jgi:hypothetical protein
MGKLIKKFIPKRSRWWFHPKDGHSMIIKTSVNGKPYVPRGVERREFLEKAAKMGVAGALGAGLASMGFPVSASPPVNWNLGPLGNSDRMVGVCRGCFLVSQERRHGPRR